MSIGDEYLQQQLISRYTCGLRTFKTHIDLSILASGSLLDGIFWLSDFRLGRVRVFSLLLFECLLLRKRSKKATKQKEAF